MRKGLKIMRKKTKRKPITDSEVLSLKALEVLIALRCSTGSCGDCDSVRDRFDVYKQSDV